MKYLSHAVLCLTAALGLSAGAALGQDYPTKPITIVVPYPPGASTDTSARAVIDKMSEALGQPVLIDNRGGAGGNVGTGSVARAAPDGYTLLWTVNPPISTNKHLFDLPYDPQADFAPISNAASTVLALAVHPSLPVTNMQELLDYARAHPGELKYGTAGLGSAHHITGEMIKRATGIDIVHVPYQGGGPAVADVVGGHIQMGFGSLPAMYPHMSNNALRIIAIAEAERFPGLPDIPTIAETVPGVTVSTWIGLLAPAGTPRPIIDKLNAALLLALKDPGVVKLYEVNGLMVRGSTPEELETIIATELDSIGKLFAEIGLGKQ